MDRELLIEIGCEELPAGWLPALTQQLGEHLSARLASARLVATVPVESFSTPRRLTARCARVPERQTDLEDLITGPAVAAAFGPDGQARPAAVGFARKFGVDPGGLERVETPKGPYLAYRRRQRGKAAVDVLADVLDAVLRDLAFPKQMRWDAWLEDGRGEFLFGRPIRWLLFLYGGRVVPFSIKRSELADSPEVQEVRSGAVTYGHRFLATTGRPGRAIKVRTFEEYRGRLLESYVILDRAERHNKIARELDANARRLGGRVTAALTGESNLLAEVPDLVEYPSVVAGAFAPEFLQLPEEVLTTTMIHHQHDFPVVNQAGRLMPAFLTVVNTEPDANGGIARNAERVLTARLRDAKFFWEADRKRTLESRVGELDTIVFHKRAGTYRQKSERLEMLAGWVARELLGDSAAAAHAGQAARLAKADLTTSMVRELTELQGTMGGIYAREEGLPEEVWRAIYFHYLPVGVESDSRPARGDLGRASVPWAAVALADKVDTLVSLFAAGERPTGTRDPFGLRRQAHGLLRIAVDLPELTGFDVVVDLKRLVEHALELLVEQDSKAPRPSLPREFDPRVVLDPAEPASLHGFLMDRARYLLGQRGYAYDEVNAVLRPSAPGWDRLNMLDQRRRLDALRAVRGSADFEALAVAFKRVTNLARELKQAPGPAADLLKEPAEMALLIEYEQRGAAMRQAIAACDYQRAFKLASGFRPAVDRFFLEVFVMVDEQSLREQRLALLYRLHALLLDLADIAEIVPRPQ